MSWECLSPISTVTASKENCRKTRKISLKKLPKNEKEVAANDFLWRKLRKNCFSVSPRPFEKQSMSPKQKTKGRDENISKNGR